MDHPGDDRAYPDPPFRALYPQAAERRNRIYVSFSVEVNQEELATPFHPIPVLLTHRVGYDQYLPIQDALESFEAQMSSDSSFEEAARHAVAYHETRGNHTTHLSRLPPWNRNVFTMRNASRLIWLDVKGLLSLGQQLLATEKLEDHAKAITTDIIELASAEEWMNQVQALKDVDDPLFHMLRDSINAHTPAHILLRWEALRRQMLDAGLRFENLIRHSEEWVRRQWAPMVVELYFLLLEYAPTCLRPSSAQ